MSTRPSNLPPCGECRYWVENGINTGQCRRRPPVVGPNNRGKKWPITAKTDWCGEGVHKSLDELRDLCAAAFMPPPKEQS